MREFPDGFFDLAICDVEYGINVGNMAYLRERKTAKQKNGARLMVRKTVHANKDWDKQPPTQEYFNELRRVSKAQIVFGIDYLNWEGLGRGRIKWDKCVAEGVGFSKFERAYCSLIENEITIPLMWAGFCQAKSLLEPTTQQGNKALNEKRIHPTQKPILLYKELLRRFASVGFKIVDTHLGSGSSRIAAHEMGFDFYGYELDKDYFDAQEKRFKNYVSQLKMHFA